MRENISNLIGLLTHSERKRLLIISLCLMAASLSDVLGVALIMPFMAVVARPELLESIGVLKAVGDVIKLESETEFLIFLGLCVVGALLFATAVKVAATFMQIRFVCMREFSISQRLVRLYLGHGYDWYLDKNTSQLGRKVLSEVSNVINGTLVFFMTLILHFSSVILFIGLLLWVDLLLTLCVISAVTLIYGTLYLLSHRKLLATSRSRNASNEERFKAINEMFGGIKDVKINGLEFLYLNRFKTAAHEYASAMAYAQCLIQLPRFALELLAFSAIMLVVLWNLTTKGDMLNALPVITVYAFAGYRLLPALQGLYAALAQLRFTSSQLQALATDLKPWSKEVIESSDEGSTNHSFQSYNVNGLTYHYPGQNDPVLSNISISIPKNSVIGIAGFSGSGKTTFADILSGLLTPSSGTLSLVDPNGVETIRNKKNAVNIGYVSQRAYLSDTSIIGNVAFGVPEDQVDHGLVEFACNAAQLGDLIRAQSDLYSSSVGEDGGKFSGGERQRIAIARALYRRPDLLILDEATSALDNVTEQALMRDMQKIFPQTTTVIIAHRLNTLQACDKIYVFAEGRIEASGSFQELSEESLIFRALLTKKSNVNY